jgi:hypothetical protein
VDEQLLRDVLGGRVSFHDIAAALAPRAPLVRLGIVHVASSHLRPVAALEVDEVVLQRLRGEPIQLGMMPVIRAASREPRAGRAGARPERGDVRGRGPGAGGRPARIVVRGRAGTGRRSLSAPSSGRSMAGSG